MAYRFKITPRVVFIAASIILFSTLGFLMFQPNASINIEENPNPNNLLTELDLNRTHSKVILLWTTFYDVWKKHPLALPCATNSQCRVTNDRRLLSISDAVVFHCRDLDMTNMPPNLNRPAGQKWVFFCLEPPSYSYYLGFRFMNNLFNWTMTYRRDSDVRTKYGSVRAIITNESISYDSGVSKKLWSQKTKMIYWMVSHCDTFSKRERFVHELSEYVDVDIYGRCGLAACPKNQTFECQSSFSKRYKFVLAFENSLCKDYVSEKFFESLRQDIVPVVFGFADYATLAPPNSYIDALSFASPKELATYLTKVANNATLYGSYLEWKKNYVLDSINYVCDLCSKLTASENHKFVYESIASWWVDGSDCRIWKKPA